ncbi:hypothetical protein [Massilia sp. YIM B02443]|uniref:hypothetical protein n=1 Tax=Massilia sp. YIM B02443 TaxID=3050127 RepID=UPI0025B69DAF|nr:hypothetical protein [Massilia sp. YIM B02443]MDN4035725.1 hypothetical protein [Massilia sp. YIM B02443]
MSALYAPALAQTAPSPELLEARARLLEAETRQALAEAERAELLARLPPAQARPLAGAVDTRQFGAAGLARAFDLALELASELCAVLPQDRRVVLYDPAAAQGAVAARTVDAALGRMSEELALRNRELARTIERHTPAARTGSLAPALAWLTAPTVLLRAGADVAALFKRDATLPASPTATLRRPCSPAPWRATARVAWPAWATAIWANSISSATPVCWNGCACWANSAACWRRTWPRCRRWPMAPRAS